VSPLNQETQQKPKMEANPQMIPQPFTANDEEELLAQLKSAGA
jgi:hypothetical protein